MNRRWIAELEAEIADLRLSVIAFGAPAMVARARECGLPPGHLFAPHFDILQRAGARMDDFVRHPDPHPDPNPTPEPPQCA